MSGSVYPVEPAARHETATAVTAVAAANTTDVATAIAMPSVLSDSHKAMA